MVYLKFSLITRLLFQLHWLPIKYCIEFKILYHASKKYISFKIPTKYELRSNEKLVLMVLTGKMLPTLVARAFSSPATYLWNSLPSHITQGMDSVPSFMRDLKIYLFSRAFNLVASVI